MRPMKQFLNFYLKRPNILTLMNKRYFRFTTYLNNDSINSKNNDLNKSPEFKTLNLDTDYDYHQYQPITSIQKPDIIGFCNSFCTNNKLYLPEFYSKNLWIRDTKSGHLGIKHNHRIDSLAEHDSILFIFSHDAQKNSFYIAHYDINTFKMIDCIEFNLAEPAHFIANNMAVSENSIYLLALDTLLVINRKTMKIVKNIKLRPSNNENNHFSKIVWWDDKLYILENKYNSIMEHSNNLLVYDANFFSLITEHCLSKYKVYDFGIDKINKKLYFDLCKYSYTIFDKIKCKQNERSFLITSPEFTNQSLILFSKLYKGNYFFLNKENIFVVNNELDLGLYHLK